MIPVPSGVRVWISAGHTDMRCGMNSLALRIQQALRRDPYAGDLYVFRGKSGKLIKIFWYDGLGASLYAKRLEKGRFVWPLTKEGVVVITPGQLGYLLEGIDWRRPQHTWRPGGRLSCDGLNRHASSPPQAAASVLFCRHDDVGRSPAERCREPEAAASGARGRAGCGTGGPGGRRG
jgi:transposase